jgi:phenylacetate-CoA ligase
VSTFYDEGAETMARPAIEALQAERLVELLPHAYEASPLIREAWDAVGLRPADVRGLEDLRAKVPFIDKEALRRFRDERDDPYGGMLAVDPAELTAIMSTSGTTGDPTLVPEVWGGERPGVMTRDFWGMGVRPGDHLSLFLFSYRGPVYGFAHTLGAVPLLFDHDLAELPRLCELSLRYRPTALYNVGNTTLHALADLSGDGEGATDLRDVFSSYRGVVVAGEPVGARARAQAAAWGAELFEHTSVGDVTAGFECPEHAGLHVWEDSVVVECLDPQGDEPVADGEPGELVATTLFNRVWPLVRYRSGDLVRVTRDACACGRTHARVWPLGRLGDEVVVDGRPVLPLDVWDAVESAPGAGLGLFQVLRPAREVDVLRLRVGHRPGEGDTAGAVRAAVLEAIGIEPEVELVTEAELLRLGPPHKIPRIAVA